MLSLIINLLSFFSFRFTKFILCIFIINSNCFPQHSVGKESVCNAGDPSLIPGSGRSPGEEIGYPYSVFLGFLCGSAGKESACNEGDLGSIPGFGRFPWRRERLPTPVFWPREFHGVAKTQTWLNNFHFPITQLCQFTQPFNLLTVIDCRMHHDLYFYHCTHPKLRFPQSLLPFL